MKTFFELSKQLVEAKDEFKPHKMYDPKTGEAHDADTEADHLKYKKMGYTHEKPEVKEGFSPKQIKMAIGIASDPRYKGGNMTGAVRAIDKIKRGLSGHKQVMAVLKRQNEDIEEAMSAKEKAAHDKAMADFKKRGGKVKKLKPGYAQGWTGKDDFGTGQKGMLNKSDTKRFGTKKKVKSMRDHVEVEVDVSINEGTEIGQTKWAEVKQFSMGKDKGTGIQITGLNGQGKTTMDQLRQKGAYIQLPSKEIPRLIKLLQKAMKPVKETESED
jgi:hypothetical protein